MRRATLISVSMAVFASNASASETLVAKAFDAQTERYIETIDRLEIPAFQLSFVENFRNLGASEALQEQAFALEALSQDLRSLKSEDLGVCRKLDLAAMLLQSEIALRRARLGVRFLNEAVDLDDVSTMSDLPHHDEWYALYLQQWTSVRADADAIFQMGEEELARAVADYDALQAQMGFAQDDDGLASHLSSRSPRSDGDAQTLALFKRKQETIWKNLVKLFPDAHGVEPAKIMRSPRGASFPVPGYYNPDEKTFYYNVLEETYDDRQADWLLIHEGAPGHHLQIHASRNAKPCDSAVPDVFQAAYVEGWAAFMEGFGAELGLYQSPEEKLAAIEWDMVRSARVAIDVGLNAYGWSDQEALDYWRENVRGQLDIAQREIDRMRRWPAQVVSYKFGAREFRRLLERFTTEVEAPIERSVFFDIAITYPPMDFTTLETSFPSLVNHAEDRKQQDETPPGQ